MIIAHITPDPLTASLLFLAVMVVAAPMGYRLGYFLGGILERNEKQNKKESD